MRLSAIAMFILSVAVCEITTFELPRLEFLTFKITVKDVEDVDEDWRTDSSCEHTYVLTN